MGNTEALHLAWWDGAQWQPYGSGVTGGGFLTRVNDMVIYQDRLYLLGKFRSVAGVASDNIACLMSPLPDEPEPQPAAVPGRPGLACTNHPNPFNPSTDILFRLPESGPGRLELFDLRGRLIRVLAAEHFEAGEHRRRWDGNDEAGRAMASGLYVVKLSGPGGKLTTKITLAR